MYSSAGGPQGPSPSGKGVTQMAYHMILDTETCDRYARKTDQPEPWNSLVYDLGFCVVDMATGETVERKSIVIAETFNNSRLMNSAYYAGKLPQYRAGISMGEDGEWQMLDCLTAYNLMRDTIRKYGIRKVWAYNAKFDQQALNSTVRTYSNGFCGFWLPYSVKVCDIWDYATCITATKSYVRWAVNHGYVSAKGNPQTSAERVYQFISGDAGFSERHTALSDAEIETAILLAARRKHKKTSHTVGCGWRGAAKVARDLN